MKTLLSKIKEQKDTSSTKDPFKEHEKGTEFSERLKLLIGNRSGRAFAKEVGISYSTLHNYLSGTSLPTLDNLITLAQYGGVNIEWLAVGEKSGTLITEKNQISHSAINNENDDFVDIRDYREISVSAGFGALNDEIEPKYTKVEASWLMSRGLKPKDCGMFKLDGDSMYPVLKHGEDMVVDMSKHNLREGRIFIINHNGLMWVKKVQINFDGVDLISENPTYKPIKLTSDEANSLIVIGQVVRGYRDF
ncbi:LexA family transcriptional regulator [Pasteurella multocida]|uniref:LexA family transcriptional regulator n=1 Tax=Pasteurella multocida TaxID=747 RepID=UPI0009C00832|nr:XRE family transcriptional regulator [Pasteurella multocida]MDC4235978.1 XRE family transcriptional regulator [Pasteurella multocida]MDX3889552.1 XRE family transcriptional regulator [Pasteurella multocida]PNW23767.1 repressor [Pasteurella multocida subsp. multocida]HDR1425354.1 helix-turn-helix domain-containing protein [Pasteurella multocida]